VLVFVLEDVHMCILSCRLQS